MARKTLKNMLDVHKQFQKDEDIKILYSTFSSIVNGYHSYIMEKVRNGEEVTLPEKMGTLHIIGRKQKVQIDENGNIKGLSPNWRKTKELWDRDEKAKSEKRIVYNTNEHSDTTIYKYRWGKTNVPVVNKSLYSLRITRANKRAVSNMIKEGKEYKNM